MTEPDLHILINVYRNLILLSCVRRYLQRRSCSLRLPAEKDESKDKGDKDGAEIKEGEGGDVESEAGTEQK